LEKHGPSLEHQMEVVAGIIDDLHGLIPKNETVQMQMADSMSIKNLLRKDPNSFAEIFAQIDPSLYHEQILGLEAILEELRNEKKGYEDAKALADTANVTAHSDL